MHHSTIPFSRSRIVAAALALASAVSLAMLATRITGTGYFRYSFFVWNTVLAWIPFAASWWMYRRATDDQLPLRLGIAVGAVWFLFFPNAPYLVTDLVHLRGLDDTPRMWRMFDVLMMSSFALNGVCLGMVSLYLMQELVRRWRGAAWSWAFAIGMSGLTAFGIYLGRFLRLNSWDVVTRPLHLLDSVLTDANPLLNAHSAFFCLGFFALWMAVYGFFVACTRLHGAER